MAITTYNELVAQVKRYVRRSGLADMDIYVTNGEQRIKYGYGDENAPYMTEAVRIAAMVDTDILTINAGDTELSLPSGFLEFAEPPYLDGDTDSMLTPLSTQQRIEKSSNATEPPEHYSIVGTKMKFPSGSDADYSLPISFYALDALTSSNVTNTLLAARPDIYLWATLLEAAIFNGNEKSAMTFLGQYKAATGGARRFEEMRRFSGPKIVRSDGWTP